MKRRIGVLLSIITVFAMISFFYAASDVKAAEEDVYQKVGAFNLTGYGDVGADAQTDRTKWCTKIGDYYVWAWDSATYENPYWKIYTSKSLKGQKTCITECYGDIYDDPSVVSNGQTIYYASDESIFRINMDGSNEEEVLWTGGDETKVAGFYNNQLFYTVRDPDAGYFKYNLYCYDLNTEETWYIDDYSVGDCYDRYLICSDGAYQMMTGKLYVYDMATDEYWDLPSDCVVAAVGDYGIRFFDGYDIKACDLECENERLIEHIYARDTVDSPGMFFWMNDIAAAYGYWNEAVIDDNTGSGSMPTHKCVFADRVQNNELDFSKDVWGFKNFSDTRCFENLDYLRKMEPTSRALLKKHLSKGAGGHCFGMSATVILQKLGLEDFLTAGSQKGLRDFTSRNNELQNRICFYQQLQYLQDCRAEAQAYKRLSAREQLDELFAKANDVKNGGNPVLFCIENNTFEREKDCWGHALVAYAAECGDFISSATNKHYDRRILLYDCNVVDWKEDNCLLYNDGTGEWEIPFYYKWRGASSRGGELSLCTTNTNAFDAKTDLKDVPLTPFAPEFYFAPGTCVTMENQTSGDQWSIDVDAGEIIGSAELKTSRDLQGIGFSSSCGLFVELPNKSDNYIIRNVQNNAKIDVNALYGDRFVSVETIGAEGVQVGADKEVSVINNTGTYEIILADNTLETKGKYDTYMVTGSGTGDVSVSTSSAGVRIEGDNIQGSTVKGSNYNEVASAVVTQADSASYGRDKSGFDQIDYVYGKPIEDATVSGVVSKTYTGKLITQKPVVKWNEEILQKDIDYSITYEKNRNVGTAAMMISGKGSYVGVIKKTFKINQAANPLTVKGKLIKISYKKLKKKAQKYAVSSAIKFSKKGQGKKTYRKIKGNKKITISKKTGMVRVKKGLKKGTYKVKVKVTAAKTRNYKKAVKTVTFRIRVR